MIEQQVAEFVVLLGIAAVAGTALRRLPVPSSVVLALIGLAGGLVLGPVDLGLSPDVLLFVLLPGLLFDASFNLRWEVLRGNLAAAIALATVGVVLTTVVTAFLGHLALGLAAPLALVLGAVLTPTDPVAVLSILRRLGVPERLANLIEAESLLNDGTGAVVFVVALAATGSGGLAPASAVLDVVRLAGGGVVVGLAVGFVLSRVTMRVDDVQVELTLTGVAAYGSYLVADVLGASGILAVVCAGLVLGNYGRPRGMSLGTQERLRSAWEYVVFLLETAAFLVIGLDVPRQDLVGAGWLLLPTAAIVLLARAVAVYGLLGFLRPFRRSVPLRWQHLVTWSGLRGVVAVALLLTLRGPQFAEVRGLVYGVVLLSIVVQGLTVSPLARVLLPPHERPAGSGQG